MLRFQHVRIVDPINSILTLKDKIVHKFRKEIKKEVNKMKIGLSSNGNSLSDAFASNFGRCSYFIIYDSTTKEVSTAYSNTAQNAAGGAGIQAAQSMINKQVESVIAPQMGPKAWNVLQGANIKVYTGIIGSIQENIDALVAGKLSEMSGAHGVGPGRGRGMGRGQGRGMGRGQGRGRGNY
jgi:predicted Fe-Mo cluster-binding NifX family protein